jgi:hypothetical protein
VAALHRFVQQAVHDGAPAHAVERGLWDQLLGLGRLCLGQFFDRLGSGDQGPALELPDGRVLDRLPHLHPRRYVSIFGPFVLPRTAYGRREGQKIDCVPLDNRLQLPDAPFSYVLQDWDQGLCVEQAFAQASATIARILGLPQSVDSLERMTAQMAEKVADFRDDRPAPPPAEEGELLVVSADGKGIVMRRTAADPAPAAHRSKGEKASQKRMATVGAVYSVDRYVRTPEQIVAALFRDEPRPANDRPAPRHKHVWASLEGATDDGPCSSLEVVYPWLLDEVATRNRGLAKEMVYLHDGQEALWEACARHLPRTNATEVLDLLHVTPRLWQAAHAFCPEGSAAAAAFVRERLLRLLRGEAAGVIRGLRGLASRRGLRGGRKKTVTTVCRYLDKNRGRLRYDVYLAQGYPIASGVIEGACRHLVKDRMERAGMHWTVTGAQAMLDVRSVHVNGEWEAYQVYRIEREAHRLYPYRALFQGADFQLAA